MTVLEREVSGEQVAEETELNRPRYSPHNRLVTYAKKGYQLVSLWAKQDSYIKPVVLGDGSTYGVEKIRTMEHGADSRLESVVAKNGFSYHGRPKNDPRVISDRAWIRESGLDELPQIKQYALDYFKHLIFRTKRKWQAAGTRGHSPKDKEVAIKENKYGRDTEGFFRKVSKQGIALFPAHLCLKKIVDTPRSHAAAHRWHLRYIEKGGSNIPLVMQFLWNYLIKGQRSS